MNSQNLEGIQSIANLLQDNLLRNRIRAIHIIEGVIKQDIEIENLQNVLNLALKNNDILVLKKILEILIENHEKISPLFRDITISLIKLFKVENFEIFSLLVKILIIIFDKKLIQEYSLLQAIQTLLEVRTEVLNKSIKKNTELNHSIRFNKKNIIKINTQRKNELLKKINLVTKHYSHIFDEIKIIDKNIKFFLMKLLYKIQEKEINVLYFLKRKILKFIYKKLWRTETPIDWANAELLENDRSTMVTFFKLLNLLMKFSNQKSKNNRKIQKILDNLTLNHLENFFAPLFQLEFNFQIMDSQKKILVLNLNLTTIIDFKYQIVSKPDVSNDTLDFYEYFERSSKSPEDLAQLMEKKPNFNDLHYIIKLFNREIVYYLKKLILFQGRVSYEVKSHQTSIETRERISETYIEEIKNSMRIPELLKYPNLVHYRTESLFPSRHTKKYFS